MAEPTTTPAPQISVKTAAPGTETEAPAPAKESGPTPGKYAAPSKSRMKNIMLFGGVFVAGAVTGALVWCFLKKRMAKKSTPAA